MTDFIAAQADLILPELMGGYAPEYVGSADKLNMHFRTKHDEDRLLDR